MRRLSEGRARRLVRLCEVASSNLREAENELLELLTYYGWKGGDSEMKKLCAGDISSIRDARSRAQLARDRMVLFEDRIARRSKARKVTK